MHILQSIYLLRLDAILFSKTVALFLIEDSLLSQSQLFELVIYLICELFTFVLIMPFLCFFILLHPAPSVLFAFSFSQRSFPSAFGYSESSLLLSVSLLYLSLPP